jgi:hypothetical protein
MTWSDLLPECGWKECAQKACHGHDDKNDHKNDNVWVAKPGSSLIPSLRLPEFLVDSSVLRLAREKRSAAALQLPGRCPRTRSEDAVCSILRSIGMPSLSTGQRHIAYALLGVGFIVCVSLLAIRWLGDGEVNDLSRTPPAEFDFPHDELIHELRDRPYRTGDAAVITRIYETQLSPSKVHQFFDVRLRKLGYELQPSIRRPPLHMRPNALEKTGRPVSYHGEYEYRKPPYVFLLAVWHPDRPGEELPGGLSVRSRPSRVPSPYPVIVYTTVIFAPDSSLLSRFGCAR